MVVIASLMSLISQVSGTPYIAGGDSPAGTDCSGLASWIANAASDRPVFGDRFNTGNEEGALLARGFQYGTAPNALVIGWNGGHTAVTLPDGTVGLQRRAWRRASRRLGRLPGWIHSSHVPPDGTGRWWRTAAAVRSAAPAGRSAAPAGRSAAPAGRSAAPAGRPASAAGRPASAAGRSDRRAAASAAAGSLIRLYPATRELRINNK